MSNRPVVLTFTRHYLPGFRAGGPIRSIANLVARLGDEFEFRIVTSDRDLGDSERYPGLTGRQWSPVGRAYVRYLDPQDFSLATLRAIINQTPHHLIYLNSFFDPWFTIRVLINRLLGKQLSAPIILAPRGEFSAGALGLGRLKKSAYLSVTRMLGLYEALYWHASTDHESSEIRQALGRVAERRIWVARDLSQNGEVEGIEWSERPRRSSIRICFLSRIAPMKNLDFALRVLSQVQTPVDFAVYGPVESKSYWHECQTLASRLPKHIQVTYEGEVRPTDVVPTLSHHDLFLLPTRGENFGHVIHEALKAGVPALISDQTPWRDLEKQGVGWVVPLHDVQGYVDAIEQVANWDAAQSRQCFDRVRRFAKDIDHDEEVVAANRTLFLNAIRARR